MSNRFAIRMFFFFFHKNVAIRQMIIDAPM